MTIAYGVERYLTERGVRFDVMLHDPTYAARETAKACSIPTDRMAKSVVLRREDGFVLAVLPADRRIGLAQINQALGEEVRLATEVEVADLFGDCDVGAVPALGAAYGLDVIVDESLDDQPEVYFEGGDHATLVRLDGHEFQFLLANARHARFIAQF